MDFNKMCWTLCARKNLNRNHLLITDDDAFKIWCIFNFLSEEKYPLVIVTEEVGLTDPISGPSFFCLWRTLMFLCASFAEVAYHRTQVGLVL